MTARRSWRNFDYWLLAALLALSAFGVIMIFSATVNTAGLENPVQRQIAYVLVGVLLLLLTATVDYRLLDIVQHPWPVLTPVALALASAGLIISLRAAELGAAQKTFGAGLTAADLQGIALGTVLVALVFVADRVRIEEIDLPAMRVIGICAGVGAAAAGALWAVRQPPERLEAMRPYLLAGGVALLYLLDCLALRFTDLLRNPVYDLMLALLALTLVAGQVAGGAQSWLGSGKVQPSELSKILVIVVLAKCLADREHRSGELATVLTSLVVIAVPALLIYLQPDLGTALVLIPIWAAMIWMVGLPFRHLLVVAAGAVVTLPLLWFALQDYMRDRILLFLNPSSDPDSYFNVHQALVSIGSGGWTGKGLTHGSQSQLHFLRVRHTDFIFAVTAEELGFLGAVALMALAAFAVWRMLRVSARARDTFGRLIASGMAMLVLFQSFVNIGMNLGLMPVTGIPLPFVSYGGSSFLTLMLGVGLVESVAMRHKKLEFD